MRKTTFMVIGLAIATAVGAAAQIVPPTPPRPVADAVEITVCRRGCDAASIQEAVDRASPGSIVRIVDPIHTECGVTVDKDLFISGAGSSGTIIQASESLDSSTDRLFWVNDGATVVFEDLTLQYGRPTDCPKGGGAILNYGMLWLERCVLRRNRGQCAGALLNDGFTTAIDCMFLDNHAAGGTTQIGMPARGSGGAIKNTRGEMSLWNCTIAGNQAKLRGGAIKNCCEASLDMFQCTVSGNRSSVAAIHVRGSVRIAHCTIALNHSNSYGSGLYVAGIAEISNTIVALNEWGDVIVTDDGAGSTFASLWVGDGRAASSYSGDPLLGPLADNGGPTWTHALLPGSGAIDAASPGVDVPAADQRGAPRARGEAPDLGAFEFDATTSDDREHSD